MLYHQKEAKAVVEEIAKTTFYYTPLHSPAKGAAEDNFFLVYGVISTAHGRSFFTVFLSVSLLQLRSLRGCVAGWEGVLLRCYFVSHDAAG